MTVQELIAQLVLLPLDAEVKALWDCTPNFDVHGVYRFGSRVVIDCGSGPDGDWDDLDPNWPMVE
jgi:hypothetical protein